MLMAVGIVFLKMLKFDLLRSHCNELDRVWLANCWLVDQILFYKLGYFAPNLSEEINLFAGIDQDPIRVLLPPLLIYQPVHRALYSIEGFELKLLSS